jgi:spore germination protein GerM
MTEPHDRTMRELTYRLIQMAPEAPPFPEEPLTTLKPRSDQSPSTPPGGPRRGWLIAAAAAAAVVIAVAVPLVLFGGGSDPVTGSTTTQAPTTTVSPTTTLVPTPPVDASVTLYFFADHVGSANLPGPHLVPVERTVEVVGTADAHDRLGAALVALFEGPTVTHAELYPGIVSNIPSGTELLGYTIDDTSNVGRAVIDVNPVFESGGGTATMLGRLAEVVFTATQFPEVDVVEFTIDGQPVTVFSSEGILLEEPQSRDGYRDLMPLIFVEAPLAGTTVESPIMVLGESNTFEAGVEYRLETADGTLLADGFSTATCGTGCWGTFELTIDYVLPDGGSGVLVVFESSAEDGRPVNVQRIPLTLAPATGSTEGQFTEVFADLPGGAPLNGAIVVEPELAITGSTNVATEIEVNGVTVPVVDGVFATTVTLTPGMNEIAVLDGVVDDVHTVTYLPGGTVEFAFLTSVGGDELVADYAQWLTGEEANRAAIEDGEIAEGDTVPNDYYIRNLNPQLRTLPVADGVTLFLPTPALGPVMMVPVQLDEWLGLFAEDGTPHDPEFAVEAEEPHFGYFGAGREGFAYWLTLDAEGNVVQITGQYRP